MILVHISCTSSKQATDVADFLIDQKLMLDAMISDKMHYKQLDHGEKVSLPRFLVMGTTKALLFSRINRIISEKYKNEVPLLYAMPIIYTDEDQTNQLRYETEKV